jgi:hypothetical protein
MTVLLLMAVGAALSVGFLGAVTEVGVQRLHEVPAVRRTVEAVLLFSVVDSVGEWAAKQDTSWLSDWSRMWSEIRQWVIVGSVVAAVILGLALWLYLAALGLVLRIVLWLIAIVIVFAGLWNGLRRS